MAPDREWFVSYDVTAREIILQRSGEDPHSVNPAEVDDLRADLLAAGVAASEHVCLTDISGGSTQEDQTA